MLKCKIQGLHDKIVNGVDADPIIDYLLAKRVISHEHTVHLQKENTPSKQCRNMLMLLYGSGNQEAFIKLYLAIKQESSLEWLVKQIDEFTDQSVIRQLQDEYISERTGFYATMNYYYYYYYYTTRRRRKRVQGQGDMSPPFQKIGRYFPANTV